MHATHLVTTFLPLALGIIMLGLGLSLQASDFMRIAKLPKAVIVGLSCQMLLLPATCFFIAKAFALSPEMSVGLMLLAASPGGATANLYSHLSNGDVALNITLTSLNSLLALFTMPFIIHLSLLHFMDEGRYIPMQFSKVIEVFLLVIIPVAIGMLVNHRCPRLSQRLSRTVKLLSALFLATVILLATYTEKNNIAGYLREVGAAALAFNVMSLAVGYFVPQLVRLSRREAIAIGMEIGIHNGTLAIYLAINVLANTAMAIPPAVYSLLMFFTAALFGWMVNARRKSLK